MSSRPAASCPTSKFQSIVDFAYHIQQLITKSPSPSVQPFPDFSLYLNALPLPQTELSPQDRVDLNKCGVALWNCCCKLSKTTAHIQDRQNLARARAFAYLLLQSATRSGRRHTGDVLKLFKITLKAARDCLDACVLDLASQILEAAAAHHESLANNDVYDVHDIPSDVGDIAQMSSEYFLLRLALAWRQERLDLGEHLYSRINISDLLKDTNGLEKLVDLLFEIGSAESDRNHYEVATKWLKRAAGLLEEYQATSANPDLGELAMNVLHAYVRALLSMEDPEAGIEAHRVLELLRKNHGQKLAVMLLQLEIFSRDPTPNTKAFFSELSAIFRSVHLIESNYKLVMHYIHHLRGLDEQLAWKGLRQFIIQRLAPHGVHGWTETAIVTLIWMTTCTSNPSNQPPLEDVEGWLNDIHLAWNQSLTAEATHGALVLIWKKVEAAAGNQDQMKTLAWCQIALHKLFEKAGEQNVGKILRKIATCHMSNSNHKAALEVLSNMPLSAKSHNLSQYLSYSVAIRRADECTAQRLLSSLASLPDEGNRLLFACVSETIRHGTKRQGAILLQKILDKYNYDLPLEVDICALLRCTTRLLVAVLEEERQVDDEMFLRLCAIFKAAARYSIKCNGEKSSNDLRFPLVECEWFSKTGYNAAIMNIRTWPARHVIDLLQYTTEIQYPYHDLAQADPAYKSRCVHLSSMVYIQAVMYTAQARVAQPTWTVEDIPRTACDIRSRPGSLHIRKTLYQKAFEKCTEFNRIASDWAQTIFDSEPEERFKLKQISLLPLGFEAILHLAEAQAGVNGLSLLQCIDQASRLNAQPRTFSLFADMIICSAMVNDPQQEKPGQPPRLPAPTAVSLLRKILNALRRFEDYDVAQASRWIRCIVQLILDTGGLAGESRNAANLKLLDGITSQAVVLAHSAREDVLVAGNDETLAHKYPADELEWLCMMLFNLAVDLYVAERIEEAKKWAEKALEIADMLTGGVRDGGGDGGVLARVLREKMGRMGWL